MNTNAIAARMALGIGLVVAGAAAAHAAKPVGIPGGIGADVRSDAGGLRIVRIVPNGPAGRAGLRPGDIIQAVNGMPTAALTDDDAGELIRGTAGTSVELDVADKQGNHPRKLRLVRVAGAIGAPEPVPLPLPEPVAAPPPPDPTLARKLLPDLERAPPPPVGGIGALILQSRGALRVAKTLPNGPAARAGIRAGEIIQAINGTPTATMPDVDAAEMAKGPIGTTVELDVSDENGAHRRKLRLVREALDTAAAAQAAAPGGNLTPDQYRDMQQLRQGTLAGIGAMLQKDSAGALRVRETVADGPAARAGIRSGAIIQAINGAPTATLTEADAGKLLRGPAGTTVELDVSDEGAPNWHKVRVVREAVAIGVYYRMLDRGIGLLTITGFTNQTPASVRQALDAFARMGARGLVIDLRNTILAQNVNNQADVAGFFVGKAVPLWLERKLGESKVTPVQSSQQRIWTQPVVVLVNAGTTQSSVLLASALRSAGRAWVVGRKTGGASTAQFFEKRDDGSARRVGITQFFSVRDEPISAEGITPDVPLDASLSAQDELARAAAIFDSPPARTDVGAR